MKHHHMVFDLCKALGEKGELISIDSLLESAKE